MVVDASPAQAAQSKTYQKDFSEPYGQNTAYQQLNATVTAVVNSNNTTSCTVSFNTAYTFTDGNAYDGNAVQNATFTNMTAGVSNHTVGINHGASSLDPKRTYITTQTYTVPGSGGINSCFNPFQFSSAAASYSDPSDADGARIVAGAALAVSLALTIIVLQGYGFNLNTAGAQAALGCIGSAMSKVVFDATYFRRTDDFHTYVAACASTALVLGVLNSLAEYVNAHYVGFLTQWQAKATAFISSGFTSARDAVKNACTGALNYLRQQH